jgi:hypothetical protein
MKNYFLSNSNIPWHSGRLNMEIMELHLRAPNTNTEEDRKVITSINDLGLGLFEAGAEPLGSI